MTKKALLIGINYRGTSSALNGCINDVNNMKQYLLKHGYADNDITILTDDTVVKPTRGNIIIAILELVMSGAERLFLHYSGHGSWIADLNGDEVDGHDECIVPLDYQQSGMLIDDQLRGLLTFMQPQSKLTVIFDACFSGTAMDLKYSYNNAVRMVRVREDGRIKLVRKQIESMRADAHYQDTPGQVVMLSGCLDTQTSADAYEEGRYQGAMTFCVLKALESEDAKSWGQFIGKIRQLLKEHRYAQIANLSSGKALSLDSIVDFC